MERKTKKDYLFKKKKKKKKKKDAIGSFRIYIFFNA